MEVKGDSPSPLGLVSATFPEVPNQIVKTTAQEDDVFVAGPGVEHELISLNDSANGKNHCMHVHPILIIAM